ncbi:hypothetical protein ACFLXX_05995, partial [Chloroflexota bacterium]
NIKYLEDDLRQLDESLNDWGDASQSVSQSIPMAIQGLKEIQAGGELNPDLQREIGKSVTGMATLEDITDQSIDVLSETASVISSAASGLERASDAKYVGKFISPVASEVNGLYDAVIDLKSAAQTFSTDLSRQQAKLKKVTDAAKDKENELYAFWNNRQGAAAKVYGVVFGGSGLVAILVIIIILIWLRRRRLVEKPIEPTEPALVSDTEKTKIYHAVTATKEFDMPPAITPTPVPPTTSVTAPESTKPDMTKQCILTIKINGEGTADPAEGPHKFKEESVIKLSARSSKGWKFVGWVGNVDEPHQHFTTITMDTDKIITATFQKLPSTTSIPSPEPTQPDTAQCTLTIKINGEGTTNPPQGPHQFKEGTVININASPSEGWQFVGWVGNVDEAYTESTTFTMDMDRTIGATFQKIK